MGCVRGGDDDGGARLTRSSIVTCLGQVLVQLLVGGCLSYLGVSRFRAVQM